MAQRKMRWKWLRHAVMLSLIGVPMAVAQEAGQESAVAQEAGQEPIDPGEVTQHAIGDANALVRPAKMRGLPPDSTLVMINGKRRHRSSAISIFTLWTGAGGARSRHSLDPVHCAQTG